MWTAVHSPTKSRITTVDHFIYIDQLCGTGMERVFDFFIMITKNFLKDIHMIIMNEYYRKSKPHPLMNEGAGGVDVPKALFYWKNVDADDVVSYIWYVIKYRQQDNVLYQGLKMPGSIT